MPCTRARPGAPVTGWPGSWATTLDVASEPSAGVVGFTVGDLRKMYPEGIPQWIQDGYESDLSAAKDSDPIWL